MKRGGVSGGSFIFAEQELAFRTLWRRRECITYRSGTLGEGRGEGGIALAMSSDETHSLEELQAALFEGMDVATKKQWKECVGFLFGVFARHR